MLLALCQQHCASSSTGAVAHGSPAVTRRVRRRVDGHGDALSSIWRGRAQSARRDANLTSWCAHRWAVLLRRLADETHLAGREGAHARLQLASARGKLR
jgi:hypothetical protein